MLRSVNVATPAVAACVSVPESVPPPAFVPMATVTLPAKVVTVLSAASRPVTVTAGAIAAPAVALVGWTVNTSFASGPVAMVNAVLFADVSAPELAESV